MFKGGTSLSKAFAIIERFSEDIDLLVVTALEGNQRKKLLRAMADRPSTTLGAVHVREREGRGYLNARYTYPTRASVDFLAPGVLLEMGCRGGPTPNQQCHVESLMAAAAESVTAGSRSDYVDLDAFEVTVLAPQRTLAEKLAFVHHRASIRDLDALRRGARHLYDIYRLLHHASTLVALRDGVMTEMMVDVDERSRAAGWGYTPRPERGFAASAAFGTDPEITDALTTGYTQIAPLIWGDRPVFDKLVACVHEHAALL